MAAKQYPSAGVAYATRASFPHNMLARPNPFLHLRPMIEMSWQQEKLVLDSLRVMYRPATGTLLCADLHLGKTGHFRKEGIAVPQAVLEADLHRLGAAIEKYQPARVVVVGDLFHSRANAEWQRFASWKLRHITVPFVLVKGNHDSSIQGQLVPMQIEAATTWHEGGWQYLHNPADAGTAPATPTISGHIHPAVRIASGSRQKLRLSCFYFSRQQCILPAFGLFTGTHVLQPKATDRVFAIAQEAVIAL